MASQYTLFILCITFNGRNKYRELNFDIIVFHGFHLSHTTWSCSTSLHPSTTNLKTKSDCAVAETPHSWSSLGPPRWCPPVVPPASPGPGLQVLSEALPASMDCFHLFLSKAPLHTCTTAISQTLREVNDFTQGFLIIHWKEVGLQRDSKRF